MSKTIQVSTENLLSISDKLARISSNICDVSSSLSKISLSSGNGAHIWTNSACSLTVMDGGISSTSAQSALNEYRRALAWYGDYTGRLSERVVKTASLFEEVDKDVLKEIGVLDEQGQEWDGILLKVLGKAGYFGSLLSGTLSLRDLNTENLVKFTAGAVNTTAKWYKSNRNLNIVARSSKKFANELRYKKLFGLDKFYKGNDLSRAASRREAFGANVSTKWGQLIKKPGTWIMAGIGSGFANYADYKTGAITSDRAVVEWAAETTGTVVLATGAAALAGAGLVAAGVTAPFWGTALGVGIVATAGVLAVDTAWAKTIGKIVGSKDKDEGIVETAGWLIGEGYDFAKGLFGKTGAVKASASGYGGASS